MIFRYYIIGGDGKSYEQQVEVQDRPGRTYLQLEADAQRLINNELAESGATQLTLPDTGRGVENWVPEVQNNFDPRTGTSNVGGRTINLSNPNFPTILEGGASPLLQSGTNLPLANIQNVRSEGENGQTFYGDVNTGYGVATPGMAGSRGTTSAGNVPFDIDAALAMGGFTQGMVPTGPANTFDPTNPSASGSGTAPDPFSYNPEFTTNLGMSSSGLTSSPGSAFGGTDIDFMEESAGAMAGFGESAAQKEARLEEEKAAAEKAAAEKAGTGDDDVMTIDEAIEYLKKNPTDVGDGVTRKLSEQRDENGAVWRKYWNTNPDGENYYTYFVVNADGLTNVDDTTQFEFPISDETYLKPMNEWSPSDLVGGTKTPWLTQPDMNVPQWTFKNTKVGSIPWLETNLVEGKNYTPADFIPPWVQTMMRLNGNQVVMVEDSEGNLTEFKLNKGEPIVSKVEGQFPVIPAEFDTEGKEIILNAEDAKMISAGGTTVNTGMGGDGATPGDNITGIRMLGEGEYPQNAVEEFLKSEGFVVPTDAAGEPVTLSALTSLPGFPPELLDPNNLFIEVTEKTSVPSDIEGEPPIVSYTTRMETNPAVAATLRLYGDRLSSLTGLQASADDMIQAQISATGGIRPGPASNLSDEDFNSLALGLRTLATTGGRMTSALGRGSYNAKGEFVSAEDGPLQILMESTPLEKADLARDLEQYKRQSALAMQQLTGGAVGGYYDAQGKFVEGDTFKQYETEQEKLRKTQRQQELDRIREQNIPSIFSTQIQAQQAEGARRQNILNQISSIYQNPAQLAAIVQAGGGPLLQLQEELANQPGMPLGPAQTPLGAAQQTEQQTEAAAGEPRTVPIYDDAGNIIRYDQQPGTGNNVTGTYRDPNFVFPSGPDGTPMTLEQFEATLDPSQRLDEMGNPLFPASASAIGVTPTAVTPTATTPIGNNRIPVSSYLPIVQGYNPRMGEAAFSELTPIQQQQAFGSAAVFGKTPEEVQEDLLAYTPMEQRSPLYGVGGTTATLRR